MYSRDYIKRMIEQFGEFLLALKQLLTENRLEEARARLDAAFREALGITPEFARQASEDALSLLVSMGRVGDLDRALMLADLLTADGDWHALVGDDQTATQNYTKAAHVLMDVLLRQPFGTAQEYTQRIDALLDKLEHTAELEPPTLARAFAYYERTGRFADAEDALWFLLQHDASAWREAAIAFYLRLLLLRDHELLLGGLSRQEVLEALQALEVSS
ncbi:MAG: DUF6483 family protein [Anaerolineae bacterium]|nr:DUF6483 family protein [Thermoflexales bacterium]MDW8053781.1 DUF6483 family protein [Anaerolineae bacterium]